MDPRGADGLLGRGCVRLGGVALEDEGCWCGCFLSPPAEVEASSIRRRFDAGPGSGVAEREAGGDGGSVGGSG